MIHFPNTCNGHSRATQKPIRVSYMSGRDTGTGVLTGCLPGKKLESGVEPGLEPRRWDLEPGRLNSCCEGDCKQPFGVMEEWKEPACVPHPKQQAPPHRQPHFHRRSPASRVRGGHRIKSSALCSQGCWCCRSVPHIRPSGLLQQGPQSLRVTQGLPRDPVRNQGKRAAKILPAHPWPAPAPLSAAPATKAPSAVLPCGHHPTRTRKHSFPWGRRKWAQPCQAGGEERFRSHCSAPQWGKEREEGGAPEPVPPAGAD